MILIGNAECQNNHSKTLKTSTLSIQVIYSIFHWTAESYLRNTVKFPNTDHDRSQTPGECAIFQLFR